MAEYGQYGNTNNVNIQALVEAQVQQRLAVQFLEPW